MPEVDQYIIFRMFHSVMDFFTYFYQQGISIFYFFGTPLNEQHFPTDLREMLLTLGFTLEETPFEIAFGLFLPTVFMISIIKTLTSIIALP